ncbi:MAG: hypothetical protein H6R00_5039 [Proteobacteria bacterium]|nr:hypothetical protein [Pseudomonadota bacterium]
MHGGRTISGQSETFVALRTTQKKPAVTTADGRDGQVRCCVAMDSSPHAIESAEPPETSASFRMNAQPFGNLLTRPHQSVNV